MRGLRITIAVVFVALAAGLVTTGVLWSRDRASLSDARALARAEADALAAAQTYAVQLTSYDYRHLDSDFNRVLGDSSPGGRFRSQFTAASTSLKPLIIQYHGVSTATVTGAGVAAGATTDRVTVVLFVDQTVTNTNSPTPRVDRNEVQITLVKSGDRWLIDDVVLPSRAAVPGPATAAPSPAR